MYDHIVGECYKVNIDKSYVVVEVNGIGYKIYCHLRDLSKIKKSTNILLNTHLRVKEDVLDLYGFLDPKDKEVFESIIGISGVGPKLGLAILSTFSSQQLYDLVIQEDVSSLTSIPGVGKKTAEKMMLDLKSKLDVKSYIFSSQNTEDSSQTNVVNKTRLVLEQLGYTPNEILEAVKEIDLSDSDNQDKEKLAVKQALAYFSKK